MEHLKIASDNYVAFTFFIGTMAMMAASVFFFFELNNTPQKWRTSVLVSGLITFIAAVHYYYMRGYNLETGDSPTFFRYVDWILTVPLMCVEFYLITKKAGAKIGLLWKLIFASLVMLVTGYAGEVLDAGHSVLWGVISGAAYFYIAYLIWFGEVAQLAQTAGAQVAKATKTPPTKTAKDHNQELTNTKEPCSFCNLLASLNTAALNAICTKTAPIIGRKFQIRPIAITCSEFKLLKYISI